MINWMKYRWLYFLISGIVITTGLFSLVKWGLPLGVDFKGGTILEYKFAKPISTEELSTKIQSAGINLSSLQTIGSNTYLLRLSPITQNEKDKITAILNDIPDNQYDELQMQTVGPSIGPELVKKTIYALLISASAILLWIAYQFKSFKFGTSAVIAMFHDSAVVLGMYSLICHFFGAEVDFLFVTAVLTILSFSVHDTIVVYDRIRELHRKEGGRVKDLADIALTETMVRSFNNSMTIVFMLLALFLLGGTTIKWFAVTLLIGTVSGTYSSPFVAVPVLVTWDELEQKRKK